MKPIYVIGHKNPDMDAVCAAIALADLKNKQGYNCVPKVIGPINHGTKYVLDKFKVPTPSYLNDVKLTVSDISYTKKAYVNEYDSINNAFNIMKNKSISAIPVVDDKKHIKKYISLEDIAKYLVSGDRTIINTCLKHLLQTLDAKILNNNRNVFSGNVKTVTFSSDAFIKEIKLTENDILIVGDRYKVIEYAINSKVQLIILTRDRIIPKGLLNKAKKNNVNILTSSYSSFELCNKLSLTNYINTIEESQTPPQIDSHCYYSDFVQIANKYNFTNYPIVNSKKECLGVLNVTDLQKVERKQVILVDHNNYEQSVDGLTEADIIEILDHHNLGTIGTNLPISFTCRPLGSTSTIVYDEFKKSKIKVTKGIAGILLSAIISDTLLLSSPITTDIDRLYAKELADIVKVDLHEYGIEMLKEASSIKGLSVQELINQDFKAYSINDKTYGIAVITTMDFDEISGSINKYVEKINEMSAGIYEAVLIFVTDILKGGSYVLYNDKSKSLVEGAFNIKELYEGIFLPGILSRKKQIIPALMQELQ